MDPGQPPAWNGEETLTALLRTSAALAVVLESDPPPAVAAAIGDSLESIDRAIEEARGHASGPLIGRREPPTLHNCDLLRGVVAYPGSLPSSS
jgi:hypothetical protein